MDRIEEIKKEMEGLDGRTKEYKKLETELKYLETDITDFDFEYKKPYYKNLSKVPTETYNTVLSFNGKVPSEKVKWLFTEYNRIFGFSFKQCLCPNKIKKMIDKIEKTYKLENEVR